MEKQKLCQSFDGYVKNGTENGIALCWRQVENQESWTVLVLAQLILFILNHPKIQSCCMYIDNTRDNTPNVDEKDKIYSVLVCWWFYFYFHFTSAPRDEMTQPIWIPMSTLSQFPCPHCISNRRHLSHYFWGVCLNHKMCSFLFRFPWASFLM